MTPKVTKSWMTALTDGSGRESWGQEGVMRESWGRVMGTGTWVWVPVFMAVGYFSANSNDPGYQRGQALMIGGTTKISG